MSATRETAAQLAAVLGEAADLAAQLAGQDEDEGTPDPDEVAAATVAVIEAQAAAEVAVIEAEAEASERRIAAQAEADERYHEARGEAEAEVATAEAEGAALVAAAIVEAAQPEPEHEEPDGDEALPLDLVSDDPIGDVVEVADEVPPLDVAPEPDHWWFRSRGRK